MSAPCVEPLTRETFAPFGAVVAPYEPYAIEINDGAATRYDALATMSPMRGGAPTLSIFRVTPYGDASPTGITVSMLERHPDTPQAFMPLATGDWLVIVAERPEPDALRVFRANGEQGVMIGAGVWHHPVVILEGRRDFLVVDRERMADTLEATLVRPPVRIDLT